MSRRKAKRAIRAAIPDLTEIDVNDSLQGTPGARVRSPPASRLA